MVTGDSGLFSLINSRLGDKPHHTNRAETGLNKHHALQQQGPAPKQSKFTDSSKVAAAPKPQDRKSLIAHQASLWLFPTLPVHM